TSPTRKPGVLNRQTRNVETIAPTKKPVGAGPIHLGSARATATAANAPKIDRNENCTGFASPRTSLIAHVGDWVLL
ncbi:MAG TPA: hypothetical protein PK867_30525, partial [Pirellulales bacterium]|nr:hypothetical protein [Pirellulales bacterium]